jgi:hypothetical protein
VVYGEAEGRRSGANSGSVRFVEGTVDGAGFGVAVQPTKDGAVCAAEGKDDLVSGGGTEVVGGDCGEFSET